MKKTLLMLALLPVLSFAKPVSLDFAGVPLVTFTQATYKSILNRDYVLAPDVVAMDRKITISVKNIEVAEIPTFLEGILAQQGISTTLKDGIYYLTAAKTFEKIATSTPDFQRDMFNGQSKNAGFLNGAAPYGVHENGNGEGAIVPRRATDESAVYQPINRTSEFMQAIIGAAFGRQSVNLAGSKLVLTGSKPDIQKMRTLLDAVDVATKSVEVSASFVEVSRSDSANSGLSLVASVLGAKLGAQVGAVGSPSGSLSFKAGSFQLVMDALQADGRFKQVSNSRVTGDESEKMTLTVGDETPTIGSTTVNQTGSAVQNIVYRPSGVILDVLPKVLGSGRMSLAVDGQISSFQSTTNGVAGSPTLVKRQVKTSVTVADGEVVVIGGLDDSKTANNTSGFSFLPRSWAGVSSSDTKTDLVLILSAKASKD